MFRYNYINDKIIKLDSSLIRNETLLYVEDNKTVRENFTEIFKTYFANVITSDNGQEAFKLYNSNSISVAILDVSIPGMDGITLAEKIREKSPEMIILIISAYSEKETLLRAVNLGLFGYMIKPVTHKDLMLNINKIIEKLPTNSIITLPMNYSWEDKQNILFYKDKPIKLTRNETKSIKILMENRNKYVTSCEIQEEIFEKKDSADNYCNNIVQLISRLKKKILKLNDSQDYFIENGYGIGYRIIV